MALSVCARPQRAVHTPRDVTARCRAAVCVCRHKIPHTSFIHTSHPLPRVGIHIPAGAGWAGVNGRDTRKEIISKKNIKKVESPAHDSSPITSVNPGAPRVIVCNESEQKAQGNGCYGNPCAALIRLRIKMISNNSQAKALGANLKNPAMCKSLLSQCQGLFLL